MSEPRRGFFLVCRDCRLTAASVLLTDTVEVVVEGKKVLQHGPKDAELVQRHAKHRMSIEEGGVFDG